MRLRRVSNASCIFATEDWSPFSASTAAGMTNVVMPDVLWLCRRLIGVVKSFGAAV